MPRVDELLFQSLERGREESVVGGGLGLQEMRGQRNHRTKIL